MQVVLQSSVGSATKVFDVTAGGPRRAMQSLCKQSKNAEDRRAWALIARLNAIVGSCPRSISNAQSGMRAWYAFHNICLQRQGNPFPPAIDYLLAWSRTFRHATTFSNYVGYVKLATELVGAATEVFLHPSLKRAKAAIVKQGSFVKRDPHFIRLDLVRRLVQKHALENLGMLWLAADVFLLRVPSEALPLVAHAHTEAEHSTAPVVTVGDDSITIHSQRRKNRLASTTLTRKCWCKQCAATCPVHVLGKFITSNCCVRG